MWFDNDGVASLRKLWHDVKNNIDQCIIWRKSHQIGVIIKLKGEKDQFWSVEQSTAQMRGQHRKLLLIWQGFEILGVSQYCFRAGHCMPAHDFSQISDSQFGRHASTVGSKRVKHYGIEEGNARASQLHGNPSDRPFLQKSGNRAIFSPVNNNIKGECTPYSTKKRNIAFGYFALTSEKLLP
ncbi:hypothetical protein AX777_23415 [Sphingobium yanoikuyae]|uniref:Uncharacterized protein n=1 Tax=Sphingobium yanoikuyae TaxID=13690 RepID=A0A177JAG2_SPHYA|nr:hypothetical protein AX777_23415 [Sphingobium yanoikuyae]